MKKRMVNLLLIRAAKRYGAASGSTWAVDIAWNALFAFFPIIVAITAILAALLGGSSIEMLLPARGNDPWLRRMQLGIHSAAQPMRRLRPAGRSCVALRRAGLKQSGSLRVRDARE